MMPQLEAILSNDSSSVINDGHGVQKDNGATKKAASKMNPLISVRRMEESPGKIQDGAPSFDQADSPDDDDMLSHPSEDNELG